MNSTSVCAARELSARDADSAVALTDSATNSRPVNALALAHATSPTQRQHPGTHAEPDPGANPAAHSVELPLSTRTDRGVRFGELTE